MKILFCSPCPLDRTLGAAQTLMDLAEELERLGCRCDLVGPAEVGAQQADYPRKLLAYVQAHAHAYDVVDFDYKRLAFDAFDRSGLGGRTLFAARCQLLIHHHLTLSPPSPLTLRTRLRALTFAARDRRRMQARVRQATATLQAADLVVVLNERDREELVRHGVAASNVRVVPNGMTEARHRAFAAVPAAPPDGDVVGFVGMFGPRKGAADFPDLVRRVAAEAPTVRFRLLGTQGRYKTADAVLACFPRALRRHVEVIPSFAPEALPGLLAPCAVGVFPSYLEGFGLGVLEMLAAAVPVIAYDAPGPPAMLPPDYLVPPGDTAAMSRKVIGLLQDRGALAEARRGARQRAEPFRWQQIAPFLLKTYEDAMAQQDVAPASKS